MRSILLVGLGHISATQLMAAHALAHAHDTSLTILPPHFEPPVSLEDIVKEFKVPDIKFEVPFFPKETAWERRNPNAPFYAKVGHKKRVDPHRKKR